MSTKIAVIGSNSFSGSDFIDLLLGKGEYDVLGVSRSPEKNKIFLPYKRHKNPKFNFHRLDINKDTNKILNLFDRFRPAFIVNFAAQSEVAPSWDHPDHWFETNVLALVRLMSQLYKKSYIKRYMHISSPEVYGSTLGETEEKSVLNPSTPYAASKAAADLFLFTLVKNFNFPLIMIRSTNVYGAHQQLFKIIPKSIINIKLDNKIELHGGGNAIKSYIHIRDVSRGELMALEKGNVGEIYHLSPNRGIRVKNLVKLICEKMGVNFQKFTKNVSERQGQDSSYVIDSTKARYKLGWKPEKSFDDGVDEVIDWINSDWNQIKKMPLNYIHKK